VNRQIYYENDEDWDAELEPECQKGYDPTVKLKKSAVLYHPWGLTKSERKAFHLANVIKFQTLSAHAQAQSSKRASTVNQAYLARSPPENETPSKRPKTEAYK